MKRAVVYDRMTAEQRAELDKAIDSLSFDERAVLLLIATRLVLGQAAYGVMDLSSERLAKRDLDRDMVEEAADLAVYHAMKFIRAAIKST